MYLFLPLQSTNVTCKRTRERIPQVSWVYCTSANFAKCKYKTKWKFFLWGHKETVTFLLLQSLWSLSISGESMVRPEGLLSGWDCVRCDWWRYETTLNVWMNGARNERTYVYGNDDDTLFSSCIPSCPVPVWFFSRQKFIGCEHKFIHKTPTIQWIYTRCMDGWMDGWLVVWLDDFWMGQQNSEHHSRARTHPYCFETVRQTCRCRCWSGLVMMLFGKLTKLPK